MMANAASDLRLHPLHVALRHAARYGRAAYLVRDEVGRVRVTIYCPRRGRLLAAVGITTDGETVVVRHI